MPSGFLVIFYPILTPHTYLSVGQKTSIKVKNAHSGVFLVGLSDLCMLFNKNSQKCFFLVGLLDLCTLLISWLAIEVNP